MDSVLASLKKHISIILQMEKMLSFLDTLPLERAKIQKTDARLISKQEEIKRYQQLKATLYESLTDGLIDKAEYLELKAVYDGKMRDAQAAETKLREELENALQNRTQDSRWIGYFKAYHNIDKLDRRMVVTLIEKILVYEDCRLEIKFQYQSDYDRTLALIQAANVKEAV